MCLNPADASLWGNNHPLKVHKIMFIPFMPLLYSAHDWPSIKICDNKLFCNKKICTLHITRLVLCVCKCCISHFISGHWKGLHRWRWWKVLSVHFYELRFMDTAHTYISKDAKWLPGHDRIWWGSNNFQYFPYFTNTFILSQCDPWQQRGKFSMKL